MSAKPITSILTVNAGAHAISFARTAIYAYLAVRFFWAPICAQL
ncbi:uncharacterized protein METZ01_LOCUS162887 [marine metagenome]|uniref:Uncharacterized protein n=1 Tax=marine metagenome TaxID=408172 RepID=A0A382B9U9_9ZZZZ